MIHFPRSIFDPHFQTVQYDKGPFMGTLRAELLRCFLKNRKSYRLS